MSYKKIYLGKGTLNEELGIVRFSISETNIQAAKHEFQGENYFTFETGELQQPDKFGRTHTIWVSKKERMEDVPLKEKKKPGRPKKQKEAVKEDAPF